MHYFKQIILCVLACLSLQNLSGFQQALAEQIQSVNSKNSLARPEANATKTDALSLSNDPEDKKTVETAATDDFDFDAFFCCVTEVLFLAVLLTVSFLLASWIVGWLDPKEQS